LCFVFTLDMRSNSVVNETNHRFRSLHKCKFIPQRAILVGFEMAERCKETVAMFFNRFTF